MNHIIISVTVQKIFCLQFCLFYRENTCFTGKILVLQRDVCFAEKNIYFTEKYFSLIIETGISCPVQILNALAP